MKKTKWAKGVMIALTVIIIFGFGILLTTSMLSKPDLDEPADQESKLDKQYVTEHYDYTFSEMLKKQMKNKTIPQTASSGNWYDASKNLTQYYANPKNVDKDSKAAYQFLKLSDSSNVSADQLNNSVLNGKGVLENEGENFKKASEKYNLNEVYLVAHALHETGEGASELAEGVEVGENKKGKPTRVKSSNRKKLKHIKTTYNFFGIGAEDSHPVKHGAERAYKEEWFSPEDAIIGGASYIADGFVSNGQDTLYKMRWNPEKPGHHQYATDVAWAEEQTDEIERIYEQLRDQDGIKVTFEIPEFDKHPKPNAKPVHADVFYVNENKKDDDKKGKITEENAHLREGPTTDFPTIKKLSKGKKVKIIGENKDWNKVKAGKKEGWVLGKLIK